MNLINLTPHELNLNDGRAIPASGGIARVTSKFGGFDVNGICRVEYGQVEGLPEPQKNTVYIVSALVLSALAGNREDVVAPATGHPETIRQDGKIVSVPGFVR